MPGRPTDYTAERADFHVDEIIKIADDEKLTQGDGSDASELRGM